MMKVSCPRCGEPIEPGEECPACLMKVAMEEPGAPEEELAAIQGIRGLEVQELVGKGGMGRVYKAVQRDLGRRVALKVLPANLAADPEFVERFKREAKVLAGLDHPNIVDVYDYGVEKGYSFLVMEYVEGVNLRELMKQGLKPEQALSIVPQICDALHYSHQKGVVHRDIKPANILIDMKGWVKIADFGLAKLREREERQLTGTCDVMGTPNYMAPEQQEGMGQVDHRADIYSLGVVFYEMLTGALPIGYFPPPSRKAEVDARLDPIVLRALQNRPDRRYQQAAEMKTDIETVKMSPAKSLRPTKGKLIVAALCLIAMAAIQYAAMPHLVAQIRGQLHPGEVGEDDGPPSLDGPPPSGPVWMHVAAAVGGIILLVGGFLWFWMLADCVQRDHRNVRMFTATGERDKIIWLALFLVLNGPAAILYYFLVRRRAGKAVELKP